MKKIGMWLLKYSCCSRNSANIYLYAIFFLSKILISGTRLSPVGFMLCGR